MAIPARRNDTGAVARACRKPIVGPRHPSRHGFGSGESFQKVLVLLRRNGLAQRRHMPSATDDRDHTLCFVERLTDLQAHMGLAAFVLLRWRVILLKQGSHFAHRMLYRR